jgi:hypothetical protein
MLGEKQQNGDNYIMRAFKCTLHIFSKYSYGERRNLQRRVEAHGIYANTYKILVRNLKRRNH